MFSYYVRFEKNVIGKRYLKLIIINLILLIYPDLHYNCPT